MSMIMIDNDNFQKEVLEDKEFKLLVFGAQWCGQCKVLKPAVMEYGTAHPEIKICLHDVEQATDAAEKLNVKSIPCVIIMKDGSEIARRNGAMSARQLNDFIEKNLQ